MNELPQIARNFLTYKETIQGKSAGTVAEYALDLRMFFRFIMHYKGLIAPETEWEQIDVAHLEQEFFQTISLSDIFEFLNYLKQKEDIARTRARKVACLRSFFKYLTVTVHLIEHNPAEFLESPQLRATLPKFLSLEESMELLNHIEGPSAKRDYAIITLFLNCGMRLSELVGINLSRISGNTVVIIGKGNKERMIYLNRACMDAIASYREVRPVSGVKDRDALFLSSRKQRISAKTVQWLVKKYLKNAGLEDKQYSTHKLRHTAATLMYQNGGVDVRALQEILGHAQLTTTQIYTHVSNNQLENAMDKNPLSKMKQKEQK